MTINITKADITEYLRVNNGSDRRSITEKAKEYVETLKEGKPSNNMIDKILNALSVNLGRKNHEAWMKAKMADGYKYGKVVDDTKKTSPLLVNFDLLPKEVQEDNIRNARQVIANLVKAGFEIRQLASEQQIKQAVLAMAEEIHNDWAKAKALKGYTYAEKRNDDPEAGPLTHRDMLSFADLLVYYPDDAAYDINTAIGVVEALMEAGFAICIPATAVAC